MKTKPLILDLFLLAGYTALVYGCALHYMPLGFIVGGTLALAFTLQCRRTDRSENDAT
jgi:hypothetical protein